MEKPGGRRDGGTEGWREAEWEDGEEGGTEGGEMDGVRTEGQREMMEGRKRREGGQGGSGERAAEPGPGGTHVEAAGGAAEEAQGAVEQHPRRTLVVPGPEPGISAGRAVREQPRAGQGCPQSQQRRQHRQQRPHPGSSSGAEREKRSSGAERDGPDGATPGPTGRDGAWSGGAWPNRPRPIGSRPKIRPGFRLPHPRASPGPGQRKGPGEGSGALGEWGIGVPPFVPPRSPHPLPSPRSAPGAGLTSSRGRGRGGGVGGRLWPLPARSLGSRCLELGGNVAPHPQGTRGGGDRDSPGQNVSCRRSERGSLPRTHGRQRGQRCLSFPGVTIHHLRPESSAGFAFAPAALEGSKSSNPDSCTP